MALETSTSQVILKDAVLQSTPIWGSPTRLLPQKWSHFFRTKDEVEAPLEEEHNTYLSAAGQKKVFFFFFFFFFSVAWLRKTWRLILRIPTFSCWTMMAILWKMSVWALLLHKNLACLIVDEIRQRSSKLVCAMLLCFRTLKLEVRNYHLQYAFFDYPPLGLEMSWNDPFGFFCNPHILHVLDTVQPKMV